MKNLAVKVIKARYQSDVEMALSDYFKNGEDKDKSIQLLITLQEDIKKYDTNRSHYPKYLVENRIFIQTELEKRIIILLKKFTRMNNEITLEETKIFFIKNHEFIKIARSQWLLANPGVLLEITSVPLNLDKNFTKWLESYHIYPKDKVICRHTISNKGRERLYMIGFNVPYAHWDRNYVVDALKVSAEILHNKKHIKALFTEDSWIYDPHIHGKASDGAPYVSFSFFSDKILTGHIYFRGLATSNNEFKKHYFFATRNQRRKALAEKGEFIPRVYGSVYPKEEIFKNLTKL